TLIQDIPSEVAGGVEHDPRRQRWQKAHLVHILEGTRLRGILGRETVAVNSFHHQAVDALGKGLLVSARSDGDDLVEAVEMQDCRFVVGVQWHPESFWDRSEGFHSLFDALLAATR